MPKPNDATHPNRDAFPRALGGPALRALAHAGIRSVADLARWTERDLARLHGMGPKGVAALREALSAAGLTLRKG
jgi:DNA-directed RNA polymerase alpha subunit